MGRGVTRSILKYNDFDDVIDNDNDNNCDEIPATKENFIKLLAIYNDFLFNMEIKGKISGNDTLDILYKNFRKEFFG